MFCQISEFPVLCRFLLTFFLAQLSNSCWKLLTVLATVLMRRKMQLWGNICSSRHLPSSPSCCCWLYLFKFSEFGFVEESEFNFCSIKLFTTAPPPPPLPSVWYDFLWPNVQTGISCSFSHDILIRAINKSQNQETHLIYHNLSASNLITNLNGVSLVPLVLM